MGSILIVGLVLLGLSFDFIYENELGLKYVASEEFIYDKTYEPGRYFVGFKSYFVKFPSNLVQVEYSNSKTAQVSILIA